MNDVPEGAYPFTTIDPSMGEAYVRLDCAAPEFGHTCTPNHGYCENGTRFVPTKLVDVAGVVHGAHEGKCLGNQFLTDLNGADVLIHVVDFTAKTDLEGEPNDVWYLEILKKGVERYHSGYHGEEKAIEEDLAEVMSAFKISDDEIEQVVRSLDLELDPDTWDGGDREALAHESRIRTKPMLIAANKMDTEAARENWKRTAADPEYDHQTFVPVSAHAGEGAENRRRTGRAGLSTRR